MAKNYVLGLDLGTNSIGWACLDLGESKILSSGVRIFDAAENPKNGKSLAEPRRIARLTRRRLHRRAVRLNKIACLLVKHGFIKSVKEVKSPSAENMWQLRVLGLTQKLSPEQIARVIYHISKHRGFKSSKKDTKNTEDKELTKANADMAALAGLFSQSGSRTIGEYLYKTYGPDEQGKNYSHIRNKLGAYSRLIKRKLNEDELKFILNTQKAQGCCLISDAFEIELLAVFNGQKGLPSFEAKVGNCELEKNYRRAPKDSLSASLFRAWQDLNHLRYQKEEYGEWVTPSIETRKTLITEAQQVRAFTEAKIAKALNIAKGSSGEYLSNIPLKKIAKSLTFTAYHELKDQLQELGKWDCIQEDIPALDAIIYCIAYLKEFSNLTSLQDAVIKEITANLKWEDAVWQHLFDSLSFDKTMGHSLQAIWKILPYFQLEDEFPITYDKASEMAYPDSFNNRETEDRHYVPLFNTENIINPVVRRTLNQCRLLINKLISIYGKPQSINIELARDLGKSFQDRKEITKKNEANAERNKDLFSESKQQGIPHPLMLRLWREQNEICPYSLQKISIEDLQNNFVEIDHILPISRSGDDSLANKVLVFSKENQNKGGQTAYEYAASKGRAFLEKYCIHVKNSVLSFRKKERLLLENFDEKKSQDYKSRHLNDTRYITRELKNHLEKTIKPKGYKGNYVRTLTGAATSTLRKLWNMGNKVREESHKHHALDAILIAGAGDHIAKFVKDITIASQYRYKEDRGSGESHILHNIKRFGFDIPEPWEGFSGDARLFVAGKVFVSRMGKKKINGEVHGATILSKRQDNNVVKTMLLRQIPKTDCTEEKVKKILSDMVDLHSSIGAGDFKGRNAFLYEIVLNHARKFGWNLAEAFSDANAPHMPNNKGEAAKHIPQIKKIKIYSSASSQLGLAAMSSEKRRAAVDSGDVVRLDLFKDNRGKYEAVPVYVFHNKELPLPSDPNAEFQFSIYKNDYLIFESDQEFIIAGKSYKQVEGYWSTNMTTSQTVVVPHDNNQKFVVKISKMTTIKKYRIDIIGQKHLINTPQKRQTLAEITAEYEAKKAALKRKKQ